MGSVSENTTFNINGVEVFSAGTWNKDKYEIEDLHSMVTAFNTLKEGFKPYLKLGHDEKQKLAKSSGLPSVGWVENIYVRGSKLYADFAHIPEKVFKLIKTKAYRKVSCEIYWNLDVNGNKYPRVLSAVALLGAETPGVMNLSDILGMYANGQNKSLGVYEAMENDDNFKTCVLELEDQMEVPKMSEENTELQKELEAKKQYVAEIEAEKAQVEAAKKELETQLEAQKGELNKYRLEAETALKAEKEAKLAKFISELEAQNLSTPSMKGHLEFLLSDKKEYSVNEKTMTREETISEILKLSQEAAKVNFDQSSKADYAKKGSEEEDKMKEIEKYAKDNKCDYATAYKAVMRGKKEMPGEEEKEEKMKKDKKE
jgi:hypothetical protein